METLTIVEQPQQIVQVIEQSSVVTIDEQSPDQITITEQVFHVEVAPDLKPSIIIQTNPTIIEVSGNVAANVIEVVSPGVQGPAGTIITYTGPEFTYNDDGALTRTDYDDGSYKTFSYSGGILSRIEFFISGGDTIRKDFVYSDGVLIRIDESTI